MVSVHQEFGQSAAGMACFSSTSSSGLNGKTQKLESLAWLQSYEGLFTYGWCWLSPNWGPGWGY